MARDTKTRFVLDPEACTRCNDCIDACPRDAIEIIEGDVRIDEGACDGCEDCALVCPTTAIQIAGMEFVPRPRRPKAPSEPSNVVSLDSARTRPLAAEVPWKLSDIAIGLVLLLALTFSQRALQMPIRLRAVSPDTAHVLLTLWMVFFYSAVVVALLAATARRGVTFDQLGVRGFKVLPAVGYSIAALVVVRILTVVYGLMASGIGLDAPGRIEVQVVRWFGPGLAGFALAVLVAVVIAPIAEELFFRGFVYTALRERIGIVGAIVLSALIFALYHANLWLIIPVVFLGMALAWLFETQESLGPPLLFHGLYNLLAVVQIYFFSGK